MVGVDNSIFCLILHPEAKPRQAVSRAKDRIELLMATLKEDNEPMVIPMPALAEFLVLAAEKGPEYLEIIRETSILRPEPFDERAAIELASAELRARNDGGKRGSADGSHWQKVKFDRQIAAIARVNNVRVLYSDDPDLKKLGNDFGIEVQSLEDLPLPPAVQEKLFKEPNATDAKAQGPSADTPPVRGSGNGRPEGQTRAEEKDTEDETQAEKGVKMPTIKQLPDDSGCQHKLDGPIRREGQFELGYCPACKNQVAYRLDEKGERTGQSFIVRMET